MPPTLPIELELYILALSIPPCTLRTLPSRRELCRTLSLVRREWTQVAQRALFECPKVFLRDTEEGREEARGWIERRPKVQEEEEEEEQQQQRGGPTAVELRFGEFDLDGGMTVFEEVVRAEWPQVESLLVREPEAALTSLQAYTDLKRLSWFGGLNTNGNNVWFLHLPSSSLVSLTLESVSLRFRSFSDPIDDDSDSLPPFPHLETLVLADAFGYDFPQYGLESMPSLKVLAWSHVGAAPCVFDLLWNAGEALKLDHLLVAGEKEMSASQWASCGVKEAFEGWTPKSITLVDPPRERMGEVEEWCREKGVKLRYLSKEEGEELDLELWALSLA
ncbi:hypothetical protein JCM6882_004626 [Rhodosporidiobolus microsporus]